MPDGILRRVTDRTWKGTLRGYGVQVFRHGDGWYFCVVHPKGHVVICPPAASFTDAARRAREHVERITGG
jgi:hypothetical protein